MESVILMLVVKELVWTCGWDTTVNIFDLQMNLLQTLTGIHDDAVFSLAQCDDYVWSGSGDKSLVVWKAT